MAQEFVWGCELSKNNKEAQWHPHPMPDDIAVSMINTLVLKQAVLGATDIENEINIIEAETRGCDDELFKQPIIRLREGLAEQCSMDLFFNASVTFRLTHGSGPIHIFGQHVIEVDKVDDDELSNGEMEEELSPIKSAKRRLSDPVGNSKKMAKLDQSEDNSEEEEDEEDDDDEEEESEEEEPIKPKPLRQRGKPAKVNEKPKRKNAKK